MKDDTTFLCITYRNDNNHNNNNIFIVNKDKAEWGVWLAHYRGPIYQSD